MKTTLLRETNSSYVVLRSLKGMTFRLGFVAADGNVRPSVGVPAAQISDWVAHYVPADEASELAEYFTNSFRKQGMSSLKGFEPTSLEDIIADQDDQTAEVIMALHDADESDSELIEPAIMGLAATLSWNYTTEAN